MLKPLNITLLRCPVSFSEEKIADEQMKRKSQIDVENDKNPKSLPFSKTFSNFCLNFDRLRRLEY